MQWWILFTLKIKTYTPKGKTIIILNIQVSPETIPGKNVEIRHGKELRELLGIRNGDYRHINATTKTFN